MFGSCDTGDPYDVAVLGMFLQTNVLGHSVKDSFHTVVFFKCRNTLFFFSTDRMLCYNMVILIALDRKQNRIKFSHNFM